MALEKIKEEIDMKKIFMIISVAMMTALAASAQTSTKLDMSLFKMAEAQRTGTSAVKSRAKNSGSKFGLSPVPQEEINEYVNVAGTLNKGAQLPQQQLDALGITVEDVTYRIVDMRVPVSKLQQLSEIPAFCSLHSVVDQRVKNSYSHMVEHVDSLQDATMATEAGLPQIYTGDSVVVGVYDSGIDFNHANFRDPETHETRIKEAVLFRNFTRSNGNYYDADGNVVAPAQIMETYTSAADIDTITTDMYNESHGTHTSSTAAGSYSGSYLNVNGTANYKAQQGAAYKADLVLAGSKSLNSSLQRLALMEMDKYAQSVGKPLVVNISLGSNGGWMDGKDEMCTFYDDFTNGGNKPGRIICMAAGNEGRDNFTIYKQLDESNDYTLRTFLPTEISVMNIVTMYSSDSTALDITIERVDTLTGQAESISMEKLVDSDMLTYLRDEDHDNRFYAKLNYTVTAELDDSYCLALVVRSKDKNPCKVRMFIWDKNYDNKEFYSYDKPGYTAGDSKSSIMTACISDCVLAVGNWSATTMYRPYIFPKEPEFTTLTNDFPRHDIRITSSYIEADDYGKSHPDCAAPGLNIQSGFNAYDTTNFCSDGSVKGINISGIASEEYGRKDGLKSCLGNMSGTSMACPNATGIVALWLQANPELTMNQLKEVIRNTCDNDEYTERHSVRFGAGKINALAGLRYILKNLPTDIQDIVNGEPKGLEDTASRKMLKDGRFVIVRDGREYSVTGQRIGVY